MYKKPYFKKFSDWYFTIAGWLRFIPEILLSPITAIVLLFSSSFIWILNKVTPHFERDYPLLIELLIELLILPVKILLGLPALLGGVMLLLSLLLEQAFYYIAKVVAFVLVIPLFLLFGVFIETKNSISFIKLYGKNYKVDEQKSYSIRNDITFFEFYWPVGFTFMKVLMNAYLLKGQIKTLLADKNMKLVSKLGQLKSLIESLEGLMRKVDAPVSDSSRYQRQRKLFLEFVCEYHQQILSKCTYSDIKAFESYFRYGSDSAVDAIIRHYYDKLAKLDYRETGKSVLINPELRLSIKLEYLYELISQNKHVKTEDNDYVFMEFLNQNYQHISSKRHTDDETIRGFLKGMDVLNSYDKARMKRILLAFHEVDKKREMKQEPRIPKEIVSVIMEFNGPARHKPEDIVGYLKWERPTLFPLTKNEEKKIADILYENEVKEDVVQPSFFSCWKA